MTEITDAIKKYLEEELLSGKEKWHCSKCARKVDASKKIDLWKLPQVLVLHLKRFAFDASTGRCEKIDTMLSTPLVLDLSSYCSSPQREGAIYEVACVANHHGRYEGGHYTATCRVCSSSGQKRTISGGLSNGGSSNGTSRSASSSIDNIVEPGFEWLHFDDELVSR